MHPFLSDPRKLLSYLCVWVLVGLLIAKFLHLAGMAAFDTAVFFSLPVAVIFGFVASSAYYVCRVLPILGRKVAPTMALFFVASIFSGAVWLGLCLSWNSLASTMGWWSITFSDSSKSLLFSAGFGCYLISMLFHDLLIASERVRNAQLQATISQVSAREAQLQMLRAQINPHFLFNSLNSISALTSIDASAARSMTIALAQFFRQSLALSERSTISLREELDLCESFLNVEKIRFGSKLQNAFCVMDQAYVAQVPPMLLQPLVENAVKHGIRDICDGGIIEVNCLVHDNWLHIGVTNPCQESSGPTLGNGMGLTNIRQRLLNMYGNQFRLHWQKQARRFAVDITLPLKIENENPDC